MSRTLEVRPWLVRVSHPYSLHTAQHLIHHWGKRPCRNPAKNNRLWESDFTSCGEAHLHPKLSQTFLAINTGNLFLWNFLNGDYIEGRCACDQEVGGSNPMVSCVISLLAPWARPWTPIALRTGWPCSLKCMTLWIKKWSNVWFDLTCRNSPPSWHQTYTPIWHVFPN